MYYFSYNFNYDDNKSNFYQTMFYYMYMSIGLYGWNEKVIRLFYAGKNAFHVYIKVGFQNLFFRLSEYFYYKHVSPSAIK